MQRRDPKASHSHRISLVAIDLDHTLLRNDSTLSDRNIEAVQQAMGRGIEIVLISGRIPRTMRSVADMLHFKGYMVALGGACILEPSTGHVIYRRKIKAGEARKAVELIHQFQLYLGFIVGDEWFVEEGGEAMEHVSRVVRCQPRLAELFVETATEPDKIVVIDFSGSDNLENFSKQAKVALRSCTVAPSSWYAVDITSDQADKGKALAVIAQRLGVPREEIMAIGNDQNDRSMLEYAGTSVAVDNAIPELKAVADFIVGSNDDHGVAEALYSLVLG